MKSPNLRHALLAVSCCLPFQAVSASNTAARSNDAPIVHTYQKILDKIDLKRRPVSTHDLPESLKLRPELGLVTAAAANGGVGDLQAPAGVGVGCRIRSTWLAAILHPMQAIEVL